MIRLDKALSISLVVAMVVVLGCLGYVVAMPKHGEKFTEFYILNIEGKAENYPQRAILGEAADLMVGVVNHEHQPASYRVEIKIDGIESRELNIGTLANGRKWEERVSFIPQVAGEKRKVEFYLFKNVEDKPCFKDPLHLYIDVYSK